MLLGAEDYNLARSPNKSVRLRYELSSQEGIRSYLLKYEGLQPSLIALAYLHPPPLRRPYSGPIYHLRRRDYD